METYYVIKGGRNTAVVVLLGHGKQKGRFVKGNIPVLYHGMTIKLDLEGQRVRDYELDLGESNRLVLEKEGVDIEEYERMLGVHRIIKGRHTWAAALNGDIVQGERQVA